MIPTTLRTLAAAALLGGALAGCGGEKPPKTAEMAEVFPRLLLPPDARFVSRSAGTDAAQVTLRSGRPSGEVEEYYRRALNRDGWRLVKEAKGSDGEVILLAEQDGPPLWVRIRPEDATTTLVELAGALVRRDTTLPAKPAS